MISPPEIIDAQRVEAAVIPITCRREEMPTVFGPAVQELFAVLDAQGIDTVGAVFAHHLTMPPGLFNFELGVAVLAPVRAAGRVQPGALLAGSAAHTTYTGPYEGLHGAWAAFDNWMTAQGLMQAVNLWEHYVHGPDKTANPAEYRTELYRLLLA
jgi:effector-binding domain-containing protein